MNESKEKATYKIILKDKKMKITIEGSYSEAFHKLVEILLELMKKN